MSMTLTAIEFIAALAIVALSVLCLSLGWWLGRKSMLDGYRLGRITQGQDPGFLEKPAKRVETVIGNEYDPFNEAMKDPRVKSIDTMEAH